MPKRRGAPGKSPNPLVSVVILNWNGTEDTIQCLKSLSDVDYDNYEIIVIDNGSVKSIAALENLTEPTFKLVKNPKNLGFAGGENSALPYCNGEIIMLLNNDAMIDPAALKNAVAVFQRNKRAGAVGGKSYGLDDDGTKSLNYYSFQRVDPITADVHTYTVDDGTETAADNVSGSCAFIRREAIKQCGYFDSRFFAYYEETDLFARFRRAGWEVVYEPSVIIWHKDGASTKNHRYMYYYLLLKNQFLFAYKNFDAKSLKAFKKTYYRNFLRSLYLYIRNGGQKEAIHKARTMSTLWNMRGILSTALARRATQATNKAFNYNDFLFTNSPLPISVILDLRASSASNATTALNTIVAGAIKPAEVIVISKKPLSLPQHSKLVRIENIVDRGTYDLTSFDWGFMTSNHDILILLNPEKLDAIAPAAFSQDLRDIYETMVAEEASVLFAGSGSRQRAALSLVRQSSLDLLAIKKSNLVTYLTINPQIYSISDEILGHYVMWLFAQCKPVFSQPVATSALAHIVEPNSSISDFPILHNSLRWHLKAFLLRTHLMRVLVIIKGRLKPKPRKAFAASANTTQDAISQDDSQPPAPHFTPIASYNAHDILNTPIFINTRDRYEPLTKLVAWLRSTGYRKIIFVDNDSTYPPLVAFLQDTEFQPILLGRNGMHKSPWESFAIRFIAKGSPYVVSDPDILPTSKTPKNTIEKLYQTLITYPKYQKAGVALKIDDLPDHYSMKKSVIEWESRFWDSSLELEEDIYAADLDTTFALYQPDTWWFLKPSIRVAGVYSMHHEPWYQDLDNPTEDMLYYRLRASNKVSTWIMGKLPKHHLRALKKEGLLPKETLKRSSDEEDK